VTRAARLATALLAFCAAPAFAEPEEFVVEPGHTFPFFAVSHLGISMQKGRFDRTSGRIVIDREAGTGSIDIAIETRSVSTGNTALDAVVRGDDFLDAASHPTITFRSSSVAFEKGVPKRAMGELTVAGATRPVELRIERFGCTRLPFLVRLTCGADAAATVKRSDFGLTAFAGLVGDEVAIEIQVEAVRQEPAPQPQPSGG
jgi:polyisoprenoid-binding protein YceI